jgi:hypothetical protein
MGAFTWVNWLHNEAEHSLPSNVEVRNEWSDTFTASYAFMKCIGRDILYL